MLENYIANQYIRAIIVSIALLIILKIGIFILERTLLKLVKKTKTDLDDIILKKSSKPITIILFFISLAIAINELTISESLLKNIHVFIYSGIAIFVGYLIYVLIDLVVFNAWQKLAEKAKIDAGESLAPLIHGVLKIILFVLVFLYILDFFSLTTHAKQYFLRGFNDYG